MSKKISWVQEVTESENSNYSKDTNKRFFDRKLFFFITLGIMFVIEAAVAICLCATVNKPVYMIGPLALMILDLLFMIVAKFINFRQRYSIVWLVIYLALSVVMTVVTLVLAFLYDGKLVMSISSAVILSVIQAAKIAFILFAVKIAKNGWTNGKKYTLNGVICSAVVGLLFIAFLVFNYAYGFMGQGGGIASERATLSYRQNDDGSYIACGTLGDGNEVIIPATFNGRTVVGADVELFGERKINSVIIEGESFKLFNVESINTVINKANPQIKIQVHKKSVNEVRSSVFYSIAGASEAVSAVMDKIVPFGLDEDETFYNYNYIGDCPSDLVYIPTVIQGKDEAFDVAKVYGGFDGYFRRTDRLEPGDLQWCYANNGGYILDEENIKVQTNQVYVPFSKVFYFSSLNGNDSKWTTTVPSQFIAMNEVEGFVNALPKRIGLTASWRAGNYHAYINNGVEDFKQYLEGKAGQTVDIEPMWRVNTPVIKAEPQRQNVITYGESTTVQFSVQSDIKYNSMLYKNGYLIMDNADNNTPDDENYPDSKVYTTKYNLVGYNPTQSGEYEIRITACDTSVTALKSDTVTCKFNFTINKKGLNFVWTLPDGEVYNKMSKSVVSEFDISDVIGDDVIEFTQNMYSVTDAGQHIANVTLGEQTDKLYYISSGESVSFRILPKPVILLWDSLSEEELIYSGGPKTVGATVTNLCDDDECNVSVSISSANKQNVGNVVYRAMSLDNGNYTLSGVSNVTATYAITPLELIFNWVQPNDLTYNARPKTVIINYRNRYSGDSCAVIMECGDNVNVGDVTYTATGLQGAQSGNYILPSSGLSTTFRISPLPVLLSWTDLSAQQAIYDGQEKSISAWVSNLCAGDVCDVSVRRTSGNAYEVGDVTYEAYGLSNGNYMLADYSNLTVLYTVTPRILQLSWTYPTDDGAIYDGTAKEAVCTVTNPVDGDDCALVINHSPNVNAGSVDYIATGLSGSASGNYVLSGEYTQTVCTFTIAQRGLRIVWTLPQNLEYDRAEKVATLDVSNIVNGDDCRTVVSHSDNINAGAVVYSINGLEGVESGNYYVPASNASVSFTIAKRVAEIAISVPEFEVYDGTAKEAACMIKNLVEGDDCTVILTYSNRVNSGTTTYTVSGDCTLAGTVTCRATGFSGEDAGNYDEDALLANASGTKTYTVQKAERDFSVTIEGWTYGDNANSPQLTLAVDDSPTVSYSYGVRDSATYSQTVPVNAGAYTLRAVVATTINYKSASRTYDFDIEQRTAQIVWNSLSASELVYDGKEKSPVASVTNLVGGDSCTVSVGITSENRVNAGDVTYTASALGNGNYKLAASGLSKVYTITKRPATLNWSLSGSYVYDGQEKAVTATVANLVAGDTCTVTVGITSENRVNAGTVTYTASALDNSDYMLGDIIWHTITITRRQAQLEWSLNGSDIYDGSEKSVTATVSNLVGDDTCSVSVNITSANRVNAGEVTYTAVSINNANYALNSNVSARSYTLVIKKAQRVGVSLSIEGWTEGDEPSSPQLSGYSGDVEYSYAASGSDSFISDVPTQAGEYTLKAVIAESQNYEELVLTVTFTVSVGQGE